MNKKFFYGLVVTGLMAFGFASTAQANCESEYNGRYGSGQPHRAFAMTTSASALKNHNHGIAFSCAWSVRQPTRGIAIRLALAQCESVRVRRDERGVCRIVNSN